MTKQKNLAVFDFDWSLIEQDSDHWTLSHFYTGSEEELSSINEVWTDVVDRTLCGIQDKGVSKENFAERLKDIPFTISMRETLRELEAHDTRVLILSDANTFYIETILKAYGVNDLVADIITNPVSEDDKGRLRVHRRVPASGPPHGCPLCSVNICKGQELERYIATHGPFTKVMYVGDGRNDYCPSTRLGSTDRLFVRQGKALDHMLKSEPEARAKIHANVTVWDSSEVVLHAVREETL